MSSARVEHQLRLQARGIEIAREGALLVGTIRVVAQLLHGMGHRPPGIEELVPVPLHQRLAVQGNAHLRRRRRPGDALRALGQGVALDQVGERSTVFTGHLHDRAQLFVEQAAERIVAPGIEVDLQALARGKGHLAQRGKSAAIATVVIGQQQAGVARGHDQLEEGAQALRVVEVGNVAAERRQCFVACMHLRQHRTAQALLAAAQADQPQLAIFFVGQQRRQLGAHVGHRRERRNDQRNRRDRFLRGAIDMPLRLHRQRVLADRDAQLQRRAQLHAHRAHRVVQQRVFARMVGRRHPVRR